MAVTVKDIAAEIGMSYSTVAYALSGKGTIKDSTRQRVIDAARAMGYVPNLYAKSFRGNRTPLIGIIVPNLIMGYNEVVQRIFLQSLETGWDVQTAVSGFCYDNEARQIQRFLEMQADIIFLRSQYQTWDEVPEDHPLRLAQNTKTKIIIWGRALRGSAFKSVKLDIEDQAKKVLKHIHDCGYKRITYTINAITPLPRSDMEFIACLKKHSSKIWGSETALRILMREDILDKLPAGEALIEDLNRQAGRLFFDMFYKTMIKPEALILQNDVCAIGAIQEAFRRGIKIGKDAGIVSLTCNIAATLSPLTLTTCDFMPEDVAQKAIEYCRDITKGYKDNLTNRRVTAQLKIGQTLCDQSATG